MLTPSEFKRHYDNATIYGALAWWSRADQNKRIEDQQRSINIMHAASGSEEMEGLMAIISSGFSNYFSFEIIEAIQVPVTDLNGEPNKRFTNALKAVRAFSHKRWIERGLHLYVVQRARSMDDDDLAYYSGWAEEEAISHLRRNENTQRSLDEGRSPQLPVPVMHQTQDPDPPPAPEPVTWTAAYPVPTNTRAPDVEMRDGMRCFSYNALYQATDGFSADRVLGSGGYGRVHAGVLRTSLLGTAGGLGPMTQVAVKMLDSASLQGEVHFQAEVRSLTHLRPANTIPLYGICHGVLRKCSYGLEHSVEGKGIPEA